jgi:hypothetical protein
MVVHRDRRDPLNTWLDHHPKLDVRGGGGDTFTERHEVVGGGGPNDVHYVCSWNMPDDWFDDLIAEIEQRNWNINVVAGWDFSHYDDTWTIEEIKADVVRKPYAIETQEIPEP